MKKTSEQIALEEFTKVGDDGLFPNHSDKDIWVAGFKAGYDYIMGLSQKYKVCKCKRSTFSRSVDKDFNPLCGKCGLKV
jgi:hypothetical protein